MSSQNQIPAGAYNLANSQEFRTIAFNLKLHEVLGFIYDYPPFFRQSDQKRGIGHLKKIALMQTSAIGAGILLNVKAKSVYPQILTMSLIRRFAIRTFLIILPFETAYHLYSKGQRQKLNILISQMHRRIINFGLDGDIHKYFQN